jgi:hypothetical protein
MVSNNPRRCEDTVVRAAIGNWVFLLNCEPFWHHWNTERPPSSCTQETFRTELTRAIEKAVPASHANTLLVERKTADLLSELGEWGKRKGLAGDILRAGPCFLSSVGATDRVRKIAESALMIDRTNRSLRLLGFCLSSLGLPAALMASDRVGEALDVLSRAGSAGPDGAGEFTREFEDDIVHWACQPADVEGRVERLQKAARVKQSDALAFALQDAVHEFHVSYINGVWESLDQDQPEEADRRLKRLIALRQQWKLSGVDSDADERLSQLQQIVPEVIRLGSMKVFRLCQEAKKAFAEGLYGEARKLLANARAATKSGKAPEVDKEIAACSCGEAVLRRNKTGRSVACGST